MKLLSLFSGSGGFELAGAMCGITPVACSEVEPYPIAVTKSRFPNMKHLGNVMKINGAEIEPVDVLTFGFPCQDVSVAGKRAGIKHEDNGDDETTRSGLFWEAVRIIEEMRCATNGKYPRFAVFENVPGLFSAEKGETFRTVIEGLIKIVEPNAVMPNVPAKGWAYADCYIGNGFSFAYRIFDAQYIRTAQRRRRVYAVLDLGGKCARQILFERESLCWNPPSGREAWQGTAPDVEGSVGADDREGAVGLDLYNFSVSGDKAVTLNANTGMSANHAGPTLLLFENHSQDSRYKGPLDVCPMLPAQLGTGGNNQPFVVEQTPFCKSHRAQSADDATTWKHADKANTLNTFDLGETRVNELIVEPVPIHDQATRFTGKHGDKSDGKGNGLGVGNPGEPMNTLTGGDRHAVVYALDRASFNQGENAQYDFEITDSGVNSTIVAKGPSAVAYSFYPQMKAGSQCLSEEVANCVVNGTNPGFQNGVIESRPPHYIVRRLTPTECARLQGFPDTWGHIEPKSDFTDEEYRFWLDVRNTHAEINGKAVKDYTKKQMLTWYNKLHNDGAEYKMWGNGIALPCALFVMEGIADALKNTTP